MSSFNAINTGEELKKWYIKLLDLSQFEDPKDISVLIRNIKHRSTFAVAAVDPSVRDITHVPESAITRRIPPACTTVVFVDNLSIATCGETRKLFLVGSAVGFKPTFKLDNEVEYLIGVVGGARNNVLTELDYFTIEKDESGYHEPLSVCRLESLKDWCERN